MIAFLRGCVFAKYPPVVVVDVAGVGYEVETSTTTFLQVPDIGQSIELYVHSYLREDVFALYGFAHERERVLFRRLLKISGVGPKLALGILSSATPDHFVSAVLSQDLNMLTRLPGIGKKTAQRLVLEMKDGLQDWSYLHQGSASVNIPLSGVGRKEGELLEALNALGFKRYEALQRVKKLSISDDSSIEELLREALQQVN
jgi:Holliday junction DNA helicase RuvA